MNSQTRAKYSTDALPGDSWEARRSKQIVRAIVRAKAERGLTTERLAAMCSDFLGQPGAVRTATLSGVFAGKRKSISAAEVEMFSAVLEVPLLDLVFPSGEVVEARPGDERQSADALISALDPAGSRYFFTPRPLLALYVDSDAFTLRNELRSTLDDLRERDETWIPTQLALSRVGERAARLRESVRRYRDEAGEEPPRMTPDVAWALEFDERREPITADFLQRVVAPLLDREDTPDGSTANTDQ